jgi:hypothetical protein
MGDFPPLFHCFHPQGRSINASLVLTFWDLEYDIRIEESFQFTSSLHRIK